MSTENTNSKTQITPNVAEKKVSEAVVDVVEDNEVIIEEDGDFFWVLQRISWGIIKTVLLLTVVGLLIWLVWGDGISSFGDKDDTIAPVAVPVESEVPVGTPAVVEVIEEVPATPEPSPVINTPVKNPVNLEKLAYQLSAQGVATTNTTIGQTVSWLKQVKAVGDISADVLRISAPDQRAQKIEETIRLAQDLLNQSPVLQKKLSAELNYFGGLGQRNNDQIKAVDEQISIALGRFDGGRVETLLQQKIDLQQVAAENLSQAKVRQTLLQNVQNFDRLLRQKSIPLLRPTGLRANPI